MDPMIPFLTGWLMGAVDQRGIECMKIVSVRFKSNNCFEVEFASGLRLWVAVSEVEEERTS